MVTLLEASLWHVNGVEIFLKRFQDSCCYQGVHAGEVLISESKVQQHRAVQRDSIEMEWGFFETAISLIAIKERFLFFGRV